MSDTSPLVRTLPNNLSSPKTSINMKTTTLEIAALFFSSTLLAQSPCLIASYPLNGNANDATGNGHDGVVYEALPAIDRFGNANACYQFDGVDDFIQLTGAFNSAQGTVSAWVYIADFADFRPVLTQRDSSYNGIATSIAINNDGPQDYRRFYKETDRRDCPGGAGQLYFKNSDPILEDSVWTNLTATSDGSHVRLYINCDEVTTYMSSGGPEDPGYWFADMCMNPTTWIGAEKRLSDQWYFKGRIDDVKIYNCALSPAELDSLCQPDFSTSMNKPKNADRIACYPNPTTGITRITGLSRSEKENLRVVDATGRTIPVFPHWQGTDLLIDLTAMPSGVYAALGIGFSARLVRE